MKTNIVRLAGVSLIFLILLSNFRLIYMLLGSDTPVWIDEGILWAFAGFLPAAAALVIINVLEYLRGTWHGFLR